MSDEKTNPNIITQIVEMLRLLKDLRGWILLAFGMAGGTGVWAWADAGTTRVTTKEAATIADSVSRKNDAPLIAHLERQDTTLSRIYFRLDELMTEKQKERADSSMRRALNNMNHEGTP